MADVLKNYLESVALALVKHENDISEIWKRLKTAYGDVKFLLSNKLSELSNLDKLWKLKDSAIIGESFSKVINVIKDLMNLAKTHNIEPRLYHGDGVNQIYKLIGNKKTTQWLQQSEEEAPEGKELWTRLLKFLERELRIQQEKQLINFSNENEPVNRATKEDKVSRLYLSNHQEKNPNYCYICGATDHISTNGPNNSKLIQYFICETFAKMTPLDRFKILRKKNLCFQCLFPGAEISTGRHQEGRCQRDFVCQHESHDRYPVKKHVLVCNEHKMNSQNEKLLQQYKGRCMRSPAIPEHSKNLQISSEFNTGYHVKTKNRDSTDTGIYQLQRITFNKQSYLIFNNTGCSDFVVRNVAIKRLGNNAKLRFNGPVNIGAVGDVTNESSGIYSVKLPLGDKGNAVLTGPSLPKITNTFPQYPLDDAVKDVQRIYEKGGGNAFAP